MSTVIHCDGLCEPKNPGGYACWGWIVTEGPHAQTQEWGCVAHGATATNNLAEYTAVGKALRWCVENGIQNPIIRSDSQLVVYQVMGEWRCTADRLIPLCQRAQVLLKQVNGRLEWVPRALNDVADDLTRTAYYAAMRGIRHSSELQKTLSTS